MPKWLENWLARHRHPASLALHGVGIPLLVWAGLLAALQLADARWGLWWRPTGLLIAGYLLQWVGHRIEGNDMGKVVLIKKLLGRPYTAVSPRYRAKTSESSG